MLLGDSTVSSCSTRLEHRSNRCAAIGDRDTAMQTAQVLAQLGGGFFACTLFVPDDIPATVSGKMGKSSSWSCSRMVLTSFQSSLRRFIFTRNALAKVFTSTFCRRPWRVVSSNQNRTQRSLGMVLRVFRTALIRSRRECQRRSWS